MKAATPLSELYETYIFRDMQMSKSPSPSTQHDELLDLNNKIARLELRAEQIVIHLRSLKWHYAEAERVRRDLLEMLQLLRAYKEQREVLEDARSLATAA